MGIDISVNIGGEAGQGIQTVGTFMAQVSHKAGLYVMAINDFESRIRGGHSFFQIRISDGPIRAPHHKINLLVALDRATFDLHREQLTDDAVVLMADTAGGAEGVLSIPFEKLAKEAGGAITSNTVAAGASLAILGTPFELFSTVLSEQFGKNPDVLKMNLAAADLGYKSVEGVSLNTGIAWDYAEPRGRLIDGSRSIALGALAADCRMAAFYPMSPATGVMANLRSQSGEFPIVVEQVEDEIAAVNMIIGASFAGVRSMTSTSGGGFCLMTEGLGLAGITETPIVIVNAQRPGPATGLPTRTAQGDLHFVINAAQDEFPRFVFAPASPAEAYETTTRAFYLAEKYQVPAIIMADHYFCEALYTDDGPFDVPEGVERFVIDGDSSYRRFAMTPSGISPRALPCRGDARVIVSGNEHLEDGHISEDKLNRAAMVDKRHAKLAGMLAEMNPPRGYHEDSEHLLVGWGSTEGAIGEAVDILRNEGVKVGSIHFNDLWPFPAAATQPLLKGARKFFIVEQNRTGQLGRLIRQETGLKHAGAILKYDGRPFYPVEIVDGLRQYLG